MSSISSVQSQLMKNALQGAQKAASGHCCSNTERQATTQVRARSRAHFRCHPFPHKELGLPKCGPLLPSGTACTEKGRAPRVAGKPPNLLKSKVPGMAGTQLKILFAGNLITVSLWVSRVPEARGFRGVCTTGARKTWGVPPCPIPQLPGSGLFRDLPAEMDGLCATKAPDHRFRFKPRLFCLDASAIRLVPSPPGLVPQGQGWRRDACAAPPRWPYPCVCDHYRYQGPRKRLCQGLRIAQRLHRVF